MLSGAVTRRYAEGLLAVAEAAGDVDAVAAGLETIAKALADHADLKGFIEHPLIAPGAKLDVLRRVFGETVHETVYRFVRVLLDRDRSAYITAVAEQFRAFAEAARGRVHVHIEAARPLSDAERTRLEQGLSQATGKQVSSDVEVNADLLAGYRVRLGNRVLDASLRGAINQFSDQLLAAGASEEGTR